MERVRDQRSRTAFLSKKVRPPARRTLSVTLGEIYSFGFSALAELDARKQKLIYCASAADRNWHLA